MPRHCLREKGLNPVCCRGEEAMVMKNGEREGSTKGNTREEHCPKVIGLENERGQIL